MTSFYVIAEEKDSDKKQGDSDFESESDDEGFEDADQDFDFVHKPSHKLRNGVKKMQEMEVENGRFRLGRGTTYVRGRFDERFSYPWWRVEFELHASKSSKNVKHATSLPSYSIRTDDNVDKSLLSQFLTRGLKVNDQHVTMLLEFIEMQNIKPTLEDLVKNLEKFSATGKVGHDVAVQISTALQHTPTGKAFAVPYFTGYAHRLFPRRVCSIFEEYSLEMLEKLNEALDKEPWVFGYWRVLKERFELSSCEVKLKSFQDCNLLNQMPIAKQDALCIYNALSGLILKDGHTFVEFKMLKKMEKLKGITNWKESLDYLKEIDVVGTSENHLGDNQHVFLTHIRHYEEGIAKQVAAIMDKKPWLDNVKIDEKIFDGDVDQIHAAQLISTKPVAVLSGRGGCGKTFVVSEILKKVLEEKKEKILQENPVNSVETNIDICEDYSEKLKEVNEQVLLTAPTGKAASILGKRIGIPAHTLHSVIFTFLHWKNKGGDHNEWKFSKVCLLVCDECRLVSVRVFYKLIIILHWHAQLQHVMLLGDVNQLPSIEPGNFLSDLFHVLEKDALCITLPTNHRSDSELIVQNAGKISLQQMPPFDPQRGFFSVKYNANADSDGNKITQVVKGVLKNEGNPFVLPKPDESQFVAFRRNDCDNINEICAQHFSKHPIKDHRGKLKFEVGDKVCVRRNVVCLDEYDKKTVKICNGEIFFIQEVIQEQDERNKKKMFFCLDNGEKKIKIDFRTLKSAKLSHAWARTIHTFQGSECDTIVYVVGNPCYQNWQHVYTAVTRGVRQVIMIYKHSSLLRAVTSHPVPRKTKLKEDIKKALRCRFRPNMHDGMSTNAQIGLDSGVGVENTFPLLPADDMKEAAVNSVLEAHGEDQKRVSEKSFPQATPSTSDLRCSTDFFISKKNLNIRKHWKEQGDTSYAPASQRSRSSRELAADHRQEMAVNASDARDPQKISVGSPQRWNSGFEVVVESPSHKRKHPENTKQDGQEILDAKIFQSPILKRKYPEGTTLLSPPQTPPCLRKFSSSLSSVSPLSQTSTEIQQAADKNTATTGTTAKYNGHCKVCKRPVRAGKDQIIYHFKGSSKSWIHVKCSTSDTQKGPV
ncbi:DNA helicase B [Stylophora pistillata]|uniref:DNA helicase B n=1 Tax=Stylophora pistillata TaxID=50429 RepID=A0A2B4SYR3_STYPI|nr:DNA helicase B [Stylophora pistillata]